MQRYDKFIGIIGRSQVYSYFEMSSHYSSLLLVSLRFKKRKNLVISCREYIRLSIITPTQKSEKSKSVAEPAVSKVAGGVIFADPIPPPADTLRLPVIEQLTQLTLKSWGL